MLEWGGISFGEEESYQLSKAVKILAVLSGATSLRLWGKIYGSKKDYYVIEGVLETSEEAKTDYFQEKRGEGVNKLVYWVNDSILGDWV